MSVAGGGDFPRLRVRPGDGGAESGAEPGAASGAGRGASARPGAQAGAGRGEDGEATVPLRAVDPLGRAALFSHWEPVEREQDEADRHRHRSAWPVTTVRCSRCRATTELSLLEALRCTLPGVHLPWVRRGHGSLVRCPACRTLSWVQLGLGRATD